MYFFSEKGWLKINYRQELNIFTLFSKAVYIKINNYCKLNIYTPPPIKRYVKIIVITNQLCNINKTFTDFSLKADYIYFNYSH